MTLRSPTYLANFPSTGFVAQSSSLSRITALVSEVATSSFSPISAISSANAYGIFETEVTTGTSSDTDAEIVEVLSHEVIAELLMTSISVIIAEPTKSFNLSLNQIRLGATLYPLPEAGAPAEPSSLKGNVVRVGADLYPFPVAGSTPETSDKDF